MGKAEQQLLRAHMINMRLAKDWSPGEVLTEKEFGEHNRLKCFVAMQRADEIINKIMRK